MEVEEGIPQTVDQIRGPAGEEHSRAPHPTHLQHSVNVQHAVMGGRKARPPQRAGHHQEAGDHQPEATLAHHTAMVLFDCGSLARLMKLGAGASCWASLSDWEDSAPTPYMACGDLHASDPDPQAPGFRCPLKASERVKAAHLIHKPELRPEGRLIVCPSPVTRHSGRLLCVPQSGPRRDSRRLGQKNPPGLGKNTTAGP
jgi:hypothetical protein